MNFNPLKLPGRSCSSMIQTFWIRILTASPDFFVPRRRIDREGAKDIL